MAEWLKRRSAAAGRAALDRHVRDTVEVTLADIKARGDAAVRELSNRFDRWARDDYRLSAGEIQDCIDQLSTQDLHDIEFAQAQVRNFAQVQRAPLHDVAVETMPSVVQGHRHIPVQTAG